MVLRFGDVEFARLPVFVAKLLALNVGVCLILL